ncbi:MAG: MBL fold metallo-hydrolase [Lachnospiraceae bacterium]|nr:MBL fold metallo-hydrolase [Lachnospiraceae bacterium]
MCKYCFNKLQKEATKFSIERNKKFADYLNLNQKFCTNSEYELAKEKCVLSAKEAVITDSEGNVVWSVPAFDFFENDEAPATVNPSLWLNGKSNYLAGVFEVVKDKIYQVRGFDIANLTIIRGKSGWIVQDVMTTAETSRAALELLEKALNEPVIDKISAIIISHSHGDHFGGVKGVVTPGQVGKAEDNKIPIYVPAGFDEECVKENIFAGTAMGRRADYQFGHSLQAGTKGIVSTGLGLDSPKGTSTFITPTNYIDKNQTVVIDGITVVFQITPGTEAPAEMNNYFADYRALWVAENCCGTLHNTYPIRGAQLRDSSGWAEYILEAMEEFADKSDVVFQSHNWPHFNTPENPNVVRDYLLNNAAIYKYMHDQTLLYANQGFTAKEIAKKVAIPEELKLNWYARPYYGSLPINVRAIYTKYLGFYNGNPNDIDPLTEVEQAKLFVEYAGPAEKIIEKAIVDFENGDYNKAAFAATQVIYTDPSNEEARLLVADAFEQLGYVSESSIWRNAYLMGAYELREGVDKKKKKLASGRDLLQCMSVDMLLKYIGITFDNHTNDRRNVRFKLDVKTKDNTESFIVQVYAGVVLTHPVYPNTVIPEKSAEITKEQLFLWGVKQLDVNEIKGNANDEIKYIQDNTVDISETARFNLSEPL